MSYVVLARKWRPQTFTDVVGQEAIVRTLKNAILTDRVSHAFLFTGTRGVGKTTSARIFAKALNCEKGPTVDPCNVCSNCIEITAGSNVDVLEVDGASNTRVDEVRDLLERVQYRPSKSKHKIFIIDEVHMLSTHSFNALLKTLEEPPPGVIFIFATTEPHKIPDTIHSRCQRFDFRQISTEQMAAHLQKILDAEKLHMTSQSVLSVARQATGSLRDALSLLDQVIAFSGEEASDEMVASILGLTDRELIAKTTAAFLTYDSSLALSVVNDVMEKGFDPKVYLEEMWERVRDWIVLKTASSAPLSRVSAEEAQSLQEKIRAIPLEELERWFEIIKAALFDLGRVAFPRYVIEVCFLRVTNQQPHVSAQEILEKLDKLEERLASGPAKKPFASPSGAQNPVPSTSSGASRTSSGGSASFSALLDAVKQRKPATAAILMQALQTNLNGQNLTLTFEEGSFYVARAKDSDFEAFLNSLAQELWGHPLRVLIETKRKPTETRAAADVDREREKEALQNPVVQKALSMFGARIEEVKPIK